MSFKESINIRFLSLSYVNASLALAPLSFNNMFNMQITANMQYGTQAQTGEARRTAASIRDTS